MSDNSFTSEPEPTHPDMSMNQESNQDKSARTRNGTSSNRTSARRDLEFRMSDEQNEITLNNKESEQGYFEEEVPKQGKLSQIKPNTTQQQQQQIIQDSQSISGYRRKKYETNNLIKSKDDQVKYTSEGSKEIVSNNNIKNQHQSIKMEFIQIDNDALDSHDGNDFFFDNGGAMKNKLVGKSFNQKKNGSIASVVSMNQNSPQTATTNAINFNVDPPSYYFADHKKDTLKQKQQQQQQQLIQQQQQQQQQYQQISNTSQNQQIKSQGQQNQQVTQQKQQLGQLQQQQLQSSQEEPKPKFRITNTSERANSNLRDRNQSQSNHNHTTTHHSQNENAEDEEYEEGQQNQNQVDYSILSNYVNSNNFFSEHDHLNQFYDKEVSPQKRVTQQTQQQMQNQQQPTKLAKQFDVKNNPYAVKPYSIDKSSQKRVKSNASNTTNNNSNVSNNINNTSLNGKIGHIPIQQQQNTSNNDEYERQKRTEGTQNPSFIIINQIQSSDLRESQRNNQSNQSANNQIYKNTVSQLESLKVVEPLLNQQQSPIEKYVSIIKAQVNNSVDNKSNIYNSQTKSPLINKITYPSQQQANTSYIEPHKSFYSGNKKSVPDALNSLNNGSNIQGKSNQLYLQRRVSQPHQRSTTNDKYDDIIKSVLYPEKKLTQPKAPEFRTNAIAELKKQLNQMSGELEFERIKSQELYTKLHGIRQKYLGKIDKSLKNLAKSEFEAEILHIEQKVKTFKKKIKAKDEEIVQMQEEAEKGRSLIPENEKLRFEIAEHKSNADNLLIKLDTKEKSIQELHRALKNANADIERLFAESGAQKQKIDERQAVIEKLEEQLQVANAKALDNIKLRGELELYKQNQLQVNQMKIEAERKKREFEQKLSEFSKVKEENISLKLEMEHQYSQLQDQNQKRELELKQLQLLAQKQSKEKDQLQYLLKDEQQKREQFQNEATRLRSELQELTEKNKSDAIVLQNKSLQVENASILKENLGMKGEVVKLQTGKLEIETENTNIKRQIMEYRLQIDDLNNKIKEYQQSTMRIQDIDKLKNECIILQREKDNMQTFYEQQIKDLKGQLNNEIRQTQIYSIKLENYVKDKKQIPQNPTTTAPLITPAITSNRRVEQDINGIGGNNSPVRFNTNKRLQSYNNNNNHNNDHFQNEIINLSQKYSTKNSLVIDKRPLDDDD